MGCKNNSEALSQKQQSNIVSTFLDCVPDTVKVEKREGE
jgi:hypothetical protein